MSPVKKQIPGGGKKHKTSGKKRGHGQRGGEENGSAVKNCSQIASVVSSPMKSIKSYILGDLDISSAPDDNSESNLESASFEVSKSNSSGSPELKPKKFLEDQEECYLRNE